MLRPISTFIIVIPFGCKDELNGAIAVERG
jgi:hypothetical protein